MANSVLNIFVPEVCLQRSRVMTSVSQRIAAGMSEHVRMRLEAELRLDPCSLDHPGEAGRCEWRSTLGRERERRFGLLLALNDALADFDPRYISDGQLGAP